jgi:hippurate hydrolase
MPSPTLDLAKTAQIELTAIRRDIHANPEIGMNEHRTAGLVARKLEEWGIEVHRGVGVTGVVGVLRNGNGQASVGLRADMDALPILEATNLPHASRTPGLMHACGHDGHTTMLLGAAKLLSETRDFNGTVNFIFQPGEEGAGGAQAMLNDGLFERFPCDFIYGMHNRPGLPVGKFLIGQGARYAGAAFFDIHVTGKGAHGARPEEGIDPALVICHLATALQSIVSRNVAARDTAVLSITRVHAGEAYNVVPETGSIGGTVRTMKPEIMTLVEQNMGRLASTIAAGFGASAKLSFRIIATPVVNNRDEAIAYGEAAVALVGAENVDTNAPPVMGSEDFAYMMERVPGAHISIGNGATAGVHNDRYDFNDEAIPYGAALYAAIVAKKMPKGTAID